MFAVVLGDFDTNLANLEPSNWDVSGVEGIYDSNDTLLTNDSAYVFTATSNGTYSFYSKDIAGKTINMGNLGTLKKYTVDEHQGMNPATGEHITIESHNRIKYMYTKELKELLNKK